MREILIDFFPILRGFFACQTRIRRAGLLVRCARESALIGRNLDGLLLYILWPQGAGADPADGPFPDGMQEARAWTVARVDGGEVAPDDAMDAVNELCFDC